MKWKTYLVMYFGTKGVGASEIARRVERVGFTTTFGSVDFEYAWKERPTKEQVLALGDKLVEALKDTGAIFNLDTHD
jgi:hypothetical protein